MKYKVFTARVAAQAYADRQTDKLPRGPLDVTRVWDIPNRLTLGRFAIAAPDADTTDVQELDDTEFDRPPPPKMMLTAGGGADSVR